MTGKWVMNYLLELIQVCTSKVSFEMQHSKNDNQPIPESMVQKFWKFSNFDKAILSQQGIAVQI